jgi:hypothetical protein
MKPIRYTLVDDEADYNSQPYPDMYAVVTRGLWDIFGLIGVVSLTMFLVGYFS